MLDPDFLNQLEKGCTQRKEQPAVPAPTPLAAMNLRAPADLQAGGTLSQSLPNYQERDAQIEMASLVEWAIRSNTSVIAEAATGTGKALDIETLIPTPTGWKRMGDLVTGDLVLDERGFPTRVTAAFDIMHGHKCYEVLFSDGSSLIADAEHEWITYTALDRKRANQQLTNTYKAKNFITSDQLAALDQLIALSTTNTFLSVLEAKALIGGHKWSLYQAAREIEPINLGKQPTRYPRLDLLISARNRLARDLSEQRHNNQAYTLVTTEQIAATLTAGQLSARANHAIPITGALTLPEAILPIDPYFLGVWLGDGTSNTSQITTADLDLITEIERAGYTVRSLPSGPYRYVVEDESGKPNRWKTGMTGCLRTLGVLQNKHIPTIYLRASEQQRRALLAGLLDTDGTVNHCGATEFTTTSPQLAQDGYELVCSLGFRPTLREGRARLREKDCGPKWTLAFTTDQQVFRLARKVAVHKERLHNYSPERNRYRYIVKTREVPSRPVRCIQVESPSHLYLAGRSMIPTHNSLAYLIPLVRTGQTGIISTANKALQEQLFYKDIPFVQKHIQDFQAVLVKGMANYVCLARLEKELNESLLRDRTLELVQESVEDASFNGDFESLPYTVPGEARARIGGDRDDCAGKKCPFRADCYYYRMREEAKSANVIVTNHKLLMLDIHSGERVLPARDVVIIDEAHTLEGVATDTFKVEAKRSQIEILLRLKQLRAHTNPRTVQDVYTLANIVWDILEERLKNPQITSLPFTSPIEEGLHLASAIEKLAGEMESSKPETLSDREGELYDRKVARTARLASALRLVFAVESDRYVYCLRRAVKNDEITAEMVPLSVASILRDSLFSSGNAVVCTSATLATPGSKNTPTLDYFCGSIGMDVEVSHTRILPLVFNYQQNALLYVPTANSVPDPAYGQTPEAARYEQALATQMLQLARASRGRAFLLFSSRRILNAVAGQILPTLKSEGFTPLIQGDKPPAELVRQFRTGEQAILFGLRTFWEGVDIQGDALSLVIIDKLPFVPVNDPVLMAKERRMKAEGKSFFRAYSLPNAVLLLKQGAGRLIRSDRDRGVMAILDSRLWTAPYGSKILNCLPPARRVNRIQDVERFFHPDYIEGNIS